MPKILIVDDQPDNLLAMTAVLATLEQELVTVSSGREALKALLHHDDFAVIIMDVQMPEMDGYETCAHIKRRPRTRDVPIIFLTAMGTGSEHSACGYAAGAVDYISKPFDPWALRAEVAVSPLSTWNVEASKCRPLPRPARTRRKTRGRSGGRSQAGAALEQAPSRRMARNHVQGRPVISQDEPIRRPRADGGACTLAGAGPGNGSP
ncbi:response regulator [Streptomyces bauhiniae]